MINEQELRYELAGYVNPFGLVDTQPSEKRNNSGNPTLYHSHFVWLMVRWGIWTRQDREQTVESVEESCEIQPGLFRRAPRGKFSEVQEGPDNYIGLAGMSAADPQITFAQEILAYGRAHRVPIIQALELGGHWWLARLFGWIRLPYVYNNLEPGTLMRIEWNPERTRGKCKPNWSAWLGRMPNLIAHFQFCAREPFPKWRAPVAIGVSGWLIVLVNLQVGWWNFLVVPLELLALACLAFGFRRLVWCAAILTTDTWIDEQKGGTTPWILSWHQVAAYRASGQSSWPCEWVARKFTERLFMRWPAGLNSCFLRFFGEAHPITRWFRS